MELPVWIAALGLLPVVAVASGAGIAPPFAFLEPTVRVSQADRARLDTGGVIARVLPADDGHIAFFAAARLKARPEALIERSEEHTSELQSQSNLVCRLLLEKKKKKKRKHISCKDQLI